MTSGAKTSLAFEALYGGAEQGAVLAYAFTLSEPTPSNNLIKNMHFHEYRRLRLNWRLLVLAALGRTARLPPLERAFVVVTRNCAGAGLDWDNAYGGLKPLLDCLVAPSAKNPSGLGLIKDDSPKHMPFPPFIKQLPAPRGHGSTRVEIFALNPLN